MSGFYLVKALKKNDYLLMKLIRFWPPFLGAGIRVKDFNREFTSITVELRLHFWNRNYVGTQFGGSLYAMTDPFYMLMLIKNLGRDYIVWDKAAAIRFKKPGTGRVTARFELTQQQIADIRKQADENYKVEPVFTVQVVDEQGVTIAEVDKTIYVRRKDRTRVTAP